MGRTPVIIIITLLLVACHPDKPSRKIIIPLRNNIGTISMQAFLDRDTLMSWVDESDNLCSFKTKYRIQSPGQKMIKESGMFKEQLADGFFLTIEHSIDPQCDTAFGELTDYPNRIRERTKYAGQIDSSVNINNTKFYIFNYSDLYPKKPMRIDAVTSHNRWILHFNFSNNILPPDSFSQIVSRTVRSVTIH